MGYYSDLDTDLTYGCQDFSELIASLDTQSQDEAIKDCEMIRETLLALFHENCESSADSYGTLGRIFQIDILIKKRERWLEEHSKYKQVCLFEPGYVSLN